MDRRSSLPTYEEVVSNSYPAANPQIHIPIEVHLPNSNIPISTSVRRCNHCNNPLKIYEKHHITWITHYIFIVLLVSLAPLYWILECSNLWFYFGAPFTMIVYYMDAFRVTKQHCSICNISTDSTIEISAHSTVPPGDYLRTIHVLTTSR